MYNVVNVLLVAMVFLLIGLLILESKIDRNEHDSEARLNRTVERVYDNICRDNIFKYVDASIAETLKDHNLKLESKVDRNKEEYEQKLEATKDDYLLEIQTFMDERISDMRQIIPIAIKAHIATMHQQRDAKGHFLTNKVKGGGEAAVAEKRRGRG